jgi:hypothetical protein
MGLRRITILLIATAMMASAAHAAEPTTAPSASVTASRYFSFQGHVVITLRFGDDADFQWLANLKEALCLKLEPAGKDILGVSPTVMRRYIQLTGPVVNIEDGVVVTNGTTIRLLVTLDDDAKPAASEFANRAAAIFPDVFAEFDRKILAKLQAELRDPLTDALKQEKDLETSLPLERAKEDTAQTQLHALGMIDIDADDIHKMAEKLDTDRENSQIDHAATDGRRQALEAAIAKLTEEAQQKAGDDPVATELEKVVSAKQERLKWAQNAHEHGMASAADVANAQGEFAEARVHVLERRENVARLAGGDAINQLQSELQTLELNTAEADAKNKAMADQAKALIAAEDLSTTIKTAQQNEEDMQTQLEAIKTEVAKDQETIDKTPQMSHQLEEVDPPTDMSVSN